eukprot:COSAG01_NODE_4123_length_5330_cov_6.167654_5_plen_271_part_00
MGTALVVVERRWAEAGVTFVRVPAPQCHHYYSVIEAPWLVNGGHGASLRQHCDRHLNTQANLSPSRVLITIIVTRRWHSSCATSPASLQSPTHVLFHIRHSVYRNFAVLTLKPMREMFCFGTWRHSYWVDCVNMEYSGQRGYLSICVKSMPCEISERSKHRSHIFRISVGGVRLMAGGGGGYWLKATVLPCAVSFAGASSAGSREMPSRPSDSGGGGRPAWEPPSHSLSPPPPPPPDGLDEKALANGQKGVGRGSGAVGMRAPDSATAVG